MNKNKNTEFGLAAILVLAVLAWCLGGKGYLAALIGLTLVTLLAPGLLTPFATIWYQLSHGLSKVMSSLLLGILFLLVVFPVGSIRRLMGKDSLLLKQFRKGKGSVFIDRDHTYTKEDLRHTF